MAEKVKKIVAYLASSLNTLGDLQSSCNRDESYLGKVINVELAVMDAASGAKAVAVTYEEVDPFELGINLGHLSLRAFKNKSEETTLKGQLLLAKATPVLPGDSPDEDKSQATAYIQNDTVKFLIFRDKKQD